MNTVDYVVISFIILWGMFLFSLIFLNYFRLYILKKTLKFKEEKVIVEAYKTEYIPEQIQEVMRYRAGIRYEKVPEKYNVHYYYLNEEYILDNKELYYKVKSEMKTFEIIVHRGYNKKGKLRYVYHTIA